ncbi:MAG: Holliday junction resolvase RuvX [Acetatifactor sp.]|nr:Holliday junction resolvase RuvX [Acetatifactor sp.]
MRIMGLDYGSKTVGVALTDPLQITAQGLEIVRRKEENKLRRTLARIEEIIVENDVELIVLGLPKNMDGTEGFRVDATMEFKDKLERRTGLKVVMMDERLTTVEADEIMDEAGIKKSDHKQYVDMIAAQIILTDYLNNRENTKDRD